MALALSLHQDVPHRTEILTMTFGVVAFSIIAQGLTVKPLLRLLGIETVRQEDYDVAKVLAGAYSASRRELDFLLQDHLVSQPTYERLRTELDIKVQTTQQSLATMQESDQRIADEEMQMAAARLIAAEKSFIQRSSNLGLISIHRAEKLLAETDLRLDTMREGR